MLVGAALARPFLKTLAQFGGRSAVRSAKPLKGITNERQGRQRCPNVFGIGSVVGWRPPGGAKKCSGSSAFCAAAAQCVRLLIRWS